MSDLIDRTLAIATLVMAKETGSLMCKELKGVIEVLNRMPSAQPEPEDYTEMKQEFLRMASYIDVLLECSDEQRESLMGFISRLAEYMPWTERD